MNNKQLKKLAKQIADQENIIALSSDPQAIEAAKNKIIQLNDSADLTIDDMVKLDEMIQPLLFQNT